MAKILLIDDDKEFRGFVAAGLEHKGHKVTVASSGRFLTSGSGKADFGATFDLVITDVLMPDVDGIEVVRMVKAANPKCKVIAMSGGGRFRKSSMLLHLADALRERPVHALRGAELALAQRAPRQEAERPVPEARQHADDRHAGQRHEREQAQAAQDPAQEAAVGHHHLLRPSYQMRRGYSKRRPVRRTSASARRT